jgi:hypothetical protein
MYAITFCVLSAVSMTNGARFWWRRLNKYFSRKTTIDGIVFDSKKEGRRYSELKLLERAGEISDLILQPEFILQEGFTKNGKRHRAIVYIADFQYMKNGQTVIEDTKGVKTEVYRIKKKLFEKRYPDLTIREV